MAILGVFTNQGLAKAIEADANEGFLIHPTNFSVSNTAGLLDPSRTTESAGVWFTGPISSRVVVDGNTVKFICTIPPGQIAPNTLETIREIYIKGLDNSLVEFLFVIGQPSTAITYDPSGSTTLELQLSLTNVDLSEIITFNFTQATEVNEHNVSPNAHPEIVEAINKAGIYFNKLAGPEPFRYRGQSFDERAEWEGTFAQVVYSGVTFTADHTGLDGNLINLVFDGIKSTDQVRAVWNNANPYNTVSHDGTGLEILPVSSQTLIGGTINVTDGDVVYKDVDGFYKRALADGTIKSNVAGIADLVAPIKRVVRSSGFIRRNTGFPIGSSLYLSTSTPGAITNVTTPVKLGTQTSASPDVILIGTGGGSSGGVGEGYDAVVTDVAGFGRFPTTQQAIDAVSDGARILIDKMEFVTNEIDATGKRIDFFFTGPETGWSRYLGTAEKQRISFSAIPTVGTWRIEWNSQESADLAFNCLAIDVENAINAMTGPGLPVTVSGSFAGGFFDVEWTLLADAPQITFNNLGTNEIQKIEFDGVPDNGTIQIDFDGQLTANLAWNDDSALFEVYLEALSNISDVIVGGSFATQQFTIEWIGIDGKTPKIQLLSNTNTLMDGVTAVNPTISTLQQGKYPASNLKIGATPIAITVATLIGGSPVGPTNAFKVGADYTRFIGLGKIYNFDSGIDLNGFIGTDIEMLFDGVVTPILHTGVTPTEEYHTEKAFGVAKTRVRTAGLYGDHPTLWAAVAAANIGDRILVLEDQSLTSIQTINADIEVVFMHKSQINVPAFLSGNLLTLGTKVRTKYLRLSITAAGSYDTAILFDGSRGYHEDITVECSNVGVILDNAFEINIGAIGVYAHGVLSRGSATVNNGFVNSSSYSNHDVLIRDLDGGVFDSNESPSPVQEQLTGVVNGINDTFAMSSEPLNEDSVLVMVDGLPRNKNEWTLTGQDIVFDPGYIPTAGQDIYALYFPKSAFYTPPRNLEILEAGVTQLFSPRKINFTGAITVTVDDPEQVSVNVAVGGVDFTNVSPNIQPDTDANYSLGTQTKAWKDLWLKDKTTGDKYRIEVDNGIFQAVLIP